MLDGVFFCFNKLENDGCNVKMSYRLLYYYFVFDFWYKEVLGLFWYNYVLGFDKDNV